MLRNMTAVYLRKGTRILLLFRQGGRVVSDVWTGSAGGHFEKDELNDPEACVLREMREELGLTKDDITDLSLRYVAVRRANGEIRQNYYFFAELGDSAPEELSSSEGTLRWFETDEIALLPMPVTAKQVILHYLETGRYTDRLYACVTGADGPVITEL